MSRARALGRVKKSCRKALLTGCGKIDFSQWEKKANEHTHSSIPHGFSDGPHSGGFSRSLVMGGGECERGSNIIYQRETKQETNKDMVKYELGDLKVMKLVAAWSDFGFYYPQ